MGNITKEQLINDLRIKSKLIKTIMCVIISFLIPIIPILLSKNLTNGVLLVSTFMFLLFTLPFGIILGIKYIINDVKLLNNINKEKYNVIIGKIKEKYTKEHTLDDEIDYKLKYTRTYKSKQFIIDKEIETEEIKVFELEVNKQEYEKAEEGKEITVVELNKEVIKLYFEQ